MKQGALRIFASAILLAFAFAAALPAAAFADEGTPPPTEEVPAAEDDGETETEAVVSGEVTEPEVTEEPGADEPMLEESLAEDPVVVEEPVAEDASAEEPVVEDPVLEEPEPAELADVLADLPEDTELVVLDEAGEPLPLASEEAADAIASSDPMWCPAGVTPGSASCSPGFGSFDELVAWIYAQNGGLGPNSAGVIWIDADYDSSIDDTSPSSVGWTGSGWYLDGSTLTNMSRYSLTIQGGWSGENNKLFSTNDPSVFDGASLDIEYWIGDITLSDLVFQDAANIGVYIDTAGKITATRVDANNNEYSGAYFSNNGYGTAKDIVITDSEFSGNGTGVWGGQGVWILSDGYVTLTNVTANGNQMSQWLYDDVEDDYYALAGDGAYISYAGKGATITDSIFNFNEGFGLEVYSDGAITLNKVTASENIESIYDDGTYFAWHGGQGAHLNNYWAVAKPVTVNDSMFEDNNSEGLLVWSNGLITIKDITSTGNWGGALLDNQGATMLGVKLTGSNILSENNGYGLTVYSNGVITLNNLIANSNDWYGAYLENCNYGSGACLNSQPVMLVGSNEFKFNGDYGLDIYSGGAITLSNANASNNSNGLGAYLNNTDSPLATKPNVTLTGTNTFNDNGQGITVMSKGIISISNLTANGNSGYWAWDDFAMDWYWASGHGAWLNNSGASSPKAVTVTVSGGNPDTEFIGNESYGLHIYSLGAISLTGVVAEGNGFGAYLDNDFDGAVGGITISGWGAGFNSNDNYGLEAYSRGVISFTHLYAWNNGSYGAYIDNRGNISAGGAAVTFSGESSFGDNQGGSGLEILSRGAITLNNLYSGYNNGSGVVLDNSYNASGPAVTLNGANHQFSNNQGDGLEIRSYGQISIANTNSYENAGFGALLDNYLGDAVVAKPITLTGNNTFESNGSTGLDITSRGTITINNVIANDNQSFGVNLRNNSVGAVGGININNTAAYWPEFNRNWSSGIEIYSRGAVVIKDLDAIGNGGYGVYVDNRDGTGTVTIGTSRTNWCNGLSENFLSGLEVYSRGAVTLSNMCNSDNGKDNDGPGGYTPYGYGAFIDNQSASTTAMVTVNGKNSFDGNASSGIEIYSRGSITLNNVRANWNDGAAGVYADNCVWSTGLVRSCTSTAFSAIKLTGTNEITNNAEDGLRIWATGAISVNNLTSKDNGLIGTWLFNAFNANSPQAVSLTGYADLFGNGASGLEVRSFGAITGANVNSSGNGGYGAYLQNRFLGEELNLGSGVTLPIPDSLTTKPALVTLTGNNVFDGNTGGGLEVHSLGVISLSHIYAGITWDDLGNEIPQLFGISLNNAYSAASAPPGVNITSGVWTSDNDTFGLNVVTKGAISINVSDAYASNNGTFGWHLNNTFSIATTPPGVTLSSANTDWAFDFDSNGGYGLLIESHGNISVAGLDATDNGLAGGAEVWGAKLVNTAGTGSVTITAGTGAVNNFNYNEGDGLIILSNGAITVANLSANSNGWTCVDWDVDSNCIEWDPIAGHGVELKNYTSPSAIPGVTINGFGEFSGNADDGLRVLSKGIITLNNISASENGQYNYWAVEESETPHPSLGRGVYLDNCDFDAGVWDCLSTAVGKGITLNGKNSFSGNFRDGLWATSLGAIKGNMFNASSNGWDCDDYAVCSPNGGAGAYLNNQWGQSGAPMGITLTTTNPALDVNGFTDNGGTGLFAYSHGPITLGNIWANNNGGEGAYVYTWSLGSTIQNVTLTGRNRFNDNAQSGLRATADNITLNNITANGNVWAGAVLSAAGNIDLKGVNTFNGNHNDGLFAQADGNITLAKVTADKNDNRGVYLEAGGKVDWACGSLTNNGSYGWELDASGTITLKGVFALGNNGGAGNTWLGSGTLIPVRSC